MEEKNSTPKTVKTTASDIGVKFLDIISKPISILCEYVEEPIRLIESYRKINEENDGKRKLDNEIRREKEFAKLNQKNIKAKQEYEKAQVKMKKEMEEAEAEIEALRIEAKIKNQTDLLNAISDYQSELSKSWVCMTQAVMNTATNYTVETTKLLTDLSKQIMQLQKEEEKYFKKQLKELQDDFGDDRETYLMLRDDLYNDKAIVINHIKEILRICREQIEIINQQSNEYAKNGIQTIKELLLPITGAATYNMLSENSENALDVSDNGKKVIEAEAVEVE